MMRTGAVATGERPATGQKLIATALIKWAFVDNKTGKPVKIPPAYDVPGLKPANPIK
jgi:acyl-CoA thioesterase FadM